MKRLVSLLSIAVALTACGGSSASEYEPVTHFALSGGPTVPKGQYVIRNSTELQALDSYFFGERPSPNFAAEMVVGISLGASRVCYSLRIVRVTYQSTETLVHYKTAFNYVGSSCLSPSPIESGTTGDFVVMPATDKPIVFIDETPA